MEHSVNTVWTGGMQFETEINSHKILLDAAPEHGGNDAGPRPKPLLLSALAGCTGMDVVSILGKMRVVPEGLNIIVNAELTEEHPKHYKNFHIIYVFKGTDLPADKLEKAIKMSQDTYCGVSYMMRQTAPVSWEIRIEN